jgi:hypothetical protein
MYLALSAASFDRWLESGRIQPWDVPAEARLRGFRAVELDARCLRPAEKRSGGLRGIFRPAGSARDHDSEMIMRMRRALAEDRVEAAAWRADTAFGPRDGLAGARAAARRALETAAALGAPTACLALDPAAGEYIGAVVDGLGPLAADAERLGVRIALDADPPAVSDALVLSVVQGVGSAWIGPGLTVGRGMRGDQPPFDVLARRAIYVRLRAGAGAALASDRLAARVGALRAAAYRGALVLDTAGGDPETSIPRWLEALRRAGA